jgi:glycosyltransferase involved in cell wall biosynthesis
MFGGLRPAAMRDLCFGKGWVQNSMKSSKIKLSICIPTLNRGSFIGATLESIVSQVTDEVEILIVDGGGTDNTKELVTKFQQGVPSLRYVCSKAQNSGTNPVTHSGAGFDRDCSLAVELAQGEYCWLFTDDDLLKPGAIQKVLEATRHQYELIVVNAEVRSADLSQTLEAARVRLTADRIYTPTEWENLFSDTAIYLSFVGGVVIKRQVWNAREKEPYIGTGFIHFGVVFQSPLQGDALVVAEPLIEIRYGDALYMRTSRYFEIWMFIWPKLIWSLPSLSESSKRLVCPREPWRKKRTLLLYRANGVFSIQEYNGWLRNRFDSRWERVVPRVIASLPGSALNLLGIMRYFLSGRLPGQVLVDLVKSPFYFARVFSNSRSSSAMPRPGGARSPSGDNSRQGLR